jgi:hypothetical protein
VLCLCGLLGLTRSRLRPSRLQALVSLLCIIIGFYEAASRVWGFMRARVTPVLGSAIISEGVDPKTR